MACDDVIMILLATGIIVSPADVVHPRLSAGRVLVLNTGADRPREITLADLLSGNGGGLG